MTRKEIKTLALRSFIRNNLDPKKVKLFSSKMTRKQLRDYIKYIKFYDARNKITIVFPHLDKIKKTDLKAFTKLFANKKIIYHEDPSLLLGIRVINNDLVYDFNLKDSFENITQSI